MLGGTKRRKAYIAFFAGKFIYLRYNISYRKNNDIERMLNKSSYTCGTIRRLFVLFKLAAMLTISFMNLLTAIR